MKADSRVIHFMRPDHIGVVLEMGNTIAKVKYPPNDMWPYGVTKWDLIDSLREVGEERIPMGEARRKKLAGYVPDPKQDQTESRKFVIGHVAHGRMSVLAGILAMMETEKFKSRIK